jgi:hypothetical protein
MKVLAPVLLLTALLWTPAAAQPASAPEHGKHFVCTVELESGHQQLLGGNIVEGTGTATVTMDSVEACGKWGQDAYDTKSGFIGYTLLVHDRDGNLMLHRSCTTPLLGKRGAASCNDEK